MRSGARATALEAIRRVVDEGAYSNLVVPALLATSRLDVRDRAFATELAYGTLRRLLPLDAAIEDRATRPMRRMTPGVRHLLRLGAYQLLYAGVPAHAAVGETVALAGGRERGFVNAVLRRLADDPPTTPTGDDVAAVSRRTGLVAWAVEELRRVVGDEAEAAAAALAERGPLTLRVNACRADRDDVLASLGPLGAMIGTADADCIVMPGGDPTSLPGWERGAFAVMDQASAAVVRALGAEPGDRVLDACAGPGGKTAALACAVVPGGEVVAGDVHPARARLVVASLRRLGLDAHVLVHDGSRPPLRGGFDGVLVDAPCSGLGSARRRPELLWRTRKDRLSTLAGRQVAIAAACAELVRPGGTLVYAVCTFTRAETDATCDAILRHRPELRPIATAGPDGTTERHRLWPHRHGTDAMFYAGFRMAG